MQSPPASVIFTIGSFNLHYYGVIMFFAIISAVLVMSKIAKRYYPNIDTEVLLDILPVIILSAIFGARAYYVILDFHYYANHLTQIPAVWNGGLSIHGALIGGIIGGWVMTKKKKISFFEYADVIAYGLLIGQAIGRFGNYFNCEAFGRPTALPWGLFIPEAYRPLQYMDYSYFHPTFLYESIWNIFVFLILFFVIRKIKKIKNGTIFFSYLLLYSAGRFCIEGVRVDSVLNIGQLPVAQIACIAGACIAVIGLLAVNKK